MSFNRRQMLAGLGAGATLAAVPHAKSQAKKAKLIVIGGGFGGATAARYLKRLMPGAEITLVEGNPAYAACPFSNLVIGQKRSMNDQIFSYDAISAEGVSVVSATAVHVDPMTKKVQLQTGDRLEYDRLVLSPGVDMRWGALEGYDEAASRIMPHAWKAGPQTQLLREQLSNMQDGGLVVMSVPAAPYRCPPGPYERASLIAHYLKTRKPKSKLIILDTKDRFSKMPLFQEAWAKHYPDHLEWRGMMDDGRVARVDPESMTLFTDFEDIKADVANVIPPQKAGWVAERAGVTDITGWCPVDPVSFESTLQPGIHVIGDAIIASPMPKSAFSANLQGKLCAMAISSIMAGEAPRPTTLVNTCYSFTTPQEAVSIVGVYSNADGAFQSIEGAGGLSPLDANLAVRASEAAQAKDWFSAITQEVFG